MAARMMTMPSNTGGAFSGGVPSLALARSLPLSPESLGAISPMDLFVSQMSTDCSEARADAIKRLVVVANAIGVDSTLTDLLPWIAANVVGGETDPTTGDGDAEDEILLVLADQLAALVPTLIPGSRALPVLPILERICSVEETVVRDKAVESVNKIVPLILGGGDAGSMTGGSASAAPSLLLAMAKRLSNADWFTAKVSACGVLPAIYRFYHAHTARTGGGRAAEGSTQPSDDEARRELRNLYRDLCEDDAPMVRRGAGKHLGKFIEAVANLPKPPSELYPRPDLCREAVDKGGKEVRRILVEEMVPLFQSLSSDEQDSVRLLACAGSGSVGCALGMDPELTSEMVFPVVKTASCDLSWRVRHNLSKEFATVAGSMGFGSSSKFDSHQLEAFSAFAGLLQDHEAEVRASAVENVARMTQLGGSDLFSSHISPALPGLADDPVMEVRSKLAQTLMDCCDDSICTALSDHLILQDFKPLLEGFLNDEFAEVQLHVLTKLSRVSRLLAKMDAVVGSILAMTKAQNWRVREAVGRLLPFLVEARGVGFFEDHLMEPWLKLLLDQVADVRSSCVSGMPKLLSVSGAGWIQKEILPQYQRIYEDSPTYLTRITIVRSFAALANADPDAPPEKQGGEVSIPAGLLEDIVTLMLRGLNDRVPNVRMVAARGFALMTAPCEEALITSKVKPALSARLTEDEDDDCKYFVQIAVENL
mmetsp:Transcript_4876/g.13851  ORF Transcript_4876/g.13851 Transcript_4876/m.13851 type:complete len:708 (-) Transcript_4876:334-2457(-)|eukprot:CAMPEP_0113569942 /NCGR_PEP_ID=MMETSP0015_2-20120614/24690_1 /TAXON_ID=2838 /ORGANISM="Odontella" /LENGTH=707 /DNA_ID=CAMNT_0000472661 /DNA_START=494 /DNA_END=2617 /DNA_ORIENTATION=- /assembly_acc=CAM_ASM_000160